jgi:hypothetical protein
MRKDLTEEKKRWEEQLEQLSEEEAKVTEFLTALDVDVDLEEDGNLLVLVETKQKERSALRDRLDAVLAAKEVVNQELSTINAAALDRRSRKLLRAKNQRCLALFKRLADYNDLAQKLIDENSAIFHEVRSIEAMLGDLEKLPIFADGDVSLPVPLRQYAGLTLERRQKRLRGTGLFLPCPDDSQVKEYEKVANKKL